MTLLLPFQVMGIWNLLACSFCHAAAQREDSQNLNLNGLIIPGFGARDLDKANIAEDGGHTESESVVSS